MTKGHSPASIVFVSHIHEERELARLLQSVLEAEFESLISVFVSSDEKTILAGESIIERIHDATKTCSVGIFLISDKSVSRPWINYELGLIKMRNLLRNNDEQVLIIPFCHSGFAVNKLPILFSSYNAIEATSSSRMEFMFQSISRAIPFDSPFRTDFTCVTADITRIQQQYTEGRRLASFLESLNIPPGNLQNALNIANSNSETGMVIVLGSWTVEKSLMREAYKQAKEFSDDIEIEQSGEMMAWTDNGYEDLAIIEKVSISKALILRNPFVFEATQ